VLRSNYSKILGSNVFPLFVIFIVRQMQEKFRAKGKKLYFGFVDLEKSI